MKTYEANLRKLNRISDDLADLAEAFDGYDETNAVSEMIKKAQFLTDDAAEIVRDKTRLAVSEALNVAAHVNGLSTPTDISVLRGVR